MGSTEGWAVSTKGARVASTVGSGLGGWVETDVGSAVGKGTSVGSCDD